MAQMLPKRITRIGNLCLYQKRRRTHPQCRNPLEMAIEKGKKKVFQYHNFDPSLNLLQAIQTIITSSQWKEAMRSSQAIPGRLGSQVAKDPKSQLWSSPGP